MNINMMLNKMNITLAFSENTINDHPDIADTTIEYISDYYPIFRPDHLNVEIIQKQEVQKPIVEDITPESNKTEKTDNTDKTDKKDK